MSKRGFTLVELAAAIGFFIVLLGGIASALATDTRTARALVVNVSAETSARRAVERLVSELRMADVKGEDLNEDGVLDTDEDTNLNGVLDADWSLADGATNAAAVSFNLTTDEWHSDGTLSASGIMTSRVTWRILNGRLVREQQPIDASRAVQRSIILDRVSAVRISRSGPIVTVSLDVPVPSDVSRYATKTVTAQVRLLN